MYMVSSEEDLQMKLIFIFRENIIPISTMKREIRSHPHEISFNFDREASIGRSLSSLFLYGFYLILVRDLP